MAIFFPNTYKKSPSGWVLCPQTLIASGGWWLRPQALSVTRLSYTNLLTTSPNFDMSVILFNLHSLSHKKSLFSKIPDDVIACDLRFSPPPTPKSWLQLCIKPCAICIPDTGCCILLMLTHHHERSLQHCKDAKQQNIRCIASSIKFLWSGTNGMEYGRKF